MVDGLRGLGATVQAIGGGFAVQGTGGAMRGGSLAAHVERRLAILGAVAGPASREGVEVVGMEADPARGFEADLAALRRA